MILISTINYCHQNVNLYLWDINIPSSFMISHTNAHRNLHFLL